MTREEAKEFYPILQDYAEGMVIECRTKPSAIKGTDVPNDWTEMNEIEHWNNIQYRVKPEPTYRPFANAEECWQEMQKHQPFGWIKSKEDGSRALITLIINERDIFINSIGGSTMYELMEKFTFADGAVFGILEEE